MDTITSTGFIRLYGTMGHACLFVRPPQDPRDYMKKQVEKAGIEPVTIVGGKMITGGGIAITTAYQHTLPAPFDERGHPSSPHIITLPISHGSMASNP